MALIKCPECGKEISDQAVSCPNCGAPILKTGDAQIRPNQQMQSGNQNAAIQRKNSGLGIAALIFSIIGCTFIIGAIFSIIDLCKKDGKKKTYSIVSLIFCGIWFIICIFFLSLGGTENSTISKNIESNMEKNYGKIEDFSYELSGDSVILDNYNGNSEILEIKSSYQIDGVDYKTDLSDFQVGIGNDDIHTVIFDEGITSVADAIFNSCDVEKIYFPKSMEIVYDNTLSYLHPDDGETIKIYYGGTQEEWENIFTEYQRTKLEDAEGAEEIGKSIADKLNEIVDDGYESSLFEYFYSANPDDLK